jgi:tetrahydromethanopterin S-methyltransferase subunit B
VTRRRGPIVRLFELEERIGELEGLVATLARVVDPTSPQLSRDDRDAIVAYAEKTRRGTDSARRDDGSPPEGG